MFVHTRDSEGPIQRELCVRVLERRKHTNTIPVLREATIIHKHTQCCEKTLLCPLVLRSHTHCRAEPVGGARGGAGSVGGAIVRGGWGGGVSGRSQQ